MVELIIRIGQGLAIVFLFGLIMDYPTQRKKAKERRLQQLKDDCKSGKHEFMGWHYDYTIGYNDKDVYRRHCKHCKQKQFTISRLHPLDDVVHTFDKLEV